MIMGTYIKDKKMNFILQKEDKKDFDLEVFIVKEILEHNRFTDEYTFYKKDDLVGKENEYPVYMKNAIPVGTIDFVEAWLSTFYGIEKINPIEVPSCLRKEEFLKREYFIVEKKDIPIKGKIFLKDVSRLKKFSRVIDCEHFFTDCIWSKPNLQDSAGIVYESEIRLDETHLFQVSEVVPILSEYRIYVQEHKIEAVANYNGDPCIFPDIKLLHKMINIYSMASDCPGAYTMDVAINELGTFLIEVHPWISVGLYNSLWSRGLLYAYRDGIEYILRHNTKPIQCKIKRG